MVTDVTPPDENQDIPEGDTGGDTGVVDDIAQEVEQSVDRGSDQPVVDTTPQQQPVAEAPPAAPQQPQVSQKEIEELQAMRAEREEQQWRNDVGRKAQVYRQNLENQGMPQDLAQDQTRSFIQNEWRVLQKDKQFNDMAQFLMGRQAGALEEAVSHGLLDKTTADALKVLLRTESGDQLKSEAARIKNERAVNAELTQLRQQQVKPQSFDNSQGAPEATGGDKDLISQFGNGGVRSEAATRAVERLMGYR